MRTSNQKTSSKVLDLSNIVTVNEASKTNEVVKDNKAGNNFTLVVGGKDYTNSRGADLINDYLTKLAKSQKQEINKFLSEYQDRQVGISGYTKGDIFVCTGVIRTIERKIGTRDVVYLAVETEEGREIGLRQFMAPVTLQGYKMNGVYEHQFRNSMGELITEEREATAGSVDDYYRPSSRYYLDFVANEAPELFKKGVHLECLGTVLRSYVARTDSPVTSMEEYKAGDKRVIETRLWRVY